MRLAAERKDKNRFFKFVKFYIKFKINGVLKNLNK